MHAYTRENTNMLLVFMVTVVLVILPGCQANNAQAQTPAYKIELIQPKHVNDKKLVIVGGTEFVVTVRISNLEKKTSPRHYVCSIYGRRSQLGLAVYE